MNEHPVEHIMFYVDAELQGDERRAFEQHVSQCPSCRARLEEQLRWETAIRRVRPLYPVPDAFRTRLTHLLTHSRPSSWRHSRIRIVLALAAVLVAALSILLWSQHRTTPPLSSFALAAVEAHQRYTRQQLPLEITSESPETISQWFVGKLPFNVKLPNYPEGPGQAKPYQIVGARLMGFNQDYVAYVAYRLRNRAISLLVTTQKAAQPSGGEQIAWQGLTFHFNAINGWKVLTWSDNGLTYALVSDFEERGQASCIVCHPGPQDQRMFEGLRLR